MGAAHDVPHLDEDSDVIVGELPRFDHLPPIDLDAEDGSALACVLRRHLSRTLDGAGDASTFNNFA